MNKKKSVFSDDEIVLSVKQGNLKNFEILIDRYKNRIINFIHKMINDYDEAQSLTQDVFLKIYETINRYKSQDNFQAFAFTIAKNITLNQIKKQKRIMFFSSIVSRNTSDSKGYNEDFLFQSGEQSPQHAIFEKKWQDDLLNTALKQVNENQRLALILKVYLEFSYKQIAEITGWSIPKIETLISRAKKNLKEKINHRLNTNIKKNEEMQEKSEVDVLKMRTI